MKWDPRIGRPMIIATLAFLVQISSSSPQPPKPPSPPGDTTIVLTSTNFSTAEFQFSIDAYYSDLSNGGIKVLQKYLSMLGYDLELIDGKLGPRTNGAVKSFISKNNIVTIGYESEVFNRELASNMAIKYPIRFGGIRYITIFLLPIFFKNTLLICQYINVL